MRERYLIDIKNQNELVVFCPEQILNNQSIKRIAFGSRTLEVDFFPLQTKKDEIIISKNVSDALLFPNFNIPLHVFIDEQTLYIGPIIGIFTTGFTPFPLRPIGERSSFFSKLLSVKKSVGALPFIFGEQHIDWDQ